MKPGDEVRFSPGAVEVRCSPSVIGTQTMDGRPLNVDPKDAADLLERIIAERVQRELPLPAAADERTQILRRVALDLFGALPMPEEIAAFVADNAPAAHATLVTRLLHRPGVAPFTGTLPPGDIEFRVLPIDPDAAKRPRVVTGPGFFVLGDHERRSGPDRYHINSIDFSDSQLWTHSRTKTRVPPQRHPAVDVGWREGGGYNPAVGASASKERITEFSREATALSKPRARQRERRER